MFVFVDIEKFSKNIEESLSKENLTPVLLYKISYESKEQFKEDLKKIKSTKKEKYCSAISISLNKIKNEIPSQIASLKKDFDIIIGEGGLNKINRFFLEQTKIDFLLNPQSSKYSIKYDFIHHLNSGMNQVLFQLAKDRDISILITTDLPKDKKLLAKEIGRITQNNRLANKFSTNTLISPIIERKESIKSTKELESICFILGMNSKQIKLNSKILENKLKKNKTKLDKKYISEGIIVE